MYTTVKERAENITRLSEDWCELNEQNNCQKIMDKLSVLKPGEREQITRQIFGQHVPVGPMGSADDDLSPLAEATGIRPLACADDAASSRLR